MANTSDRVKEGIHDAAERVKDAAHNVAEKTKDVVYNVSVPSGHTNWPIGTFSFASAIPSIWGASSRATFRIRRRSAARSLNKSGT